jgi:hypothetical protein
MRQFFTEKTPATEVAMGVVRPTEQQSAMTANVNHRAMALVMAMFAGRAADVGRWLAAGRKGWPSQRGSVTAADSLRSLGALTPWVKMPLPGGAGTK